MRGNKILRRSLALVLCIALSLGMFEGIPFVKENFTTVETAHAATGVINKLNSLKSRFPGGKFWNHQVTAYSNNGDQLMARRDESFSNSVTSQTCATHTGTAGVGSYDCNYFDGGIQCMGFAKKIFYEVFGQRESSLPRRYDRANVMVGDYVRVNNDGHSGVVLSRSGNTIYLVECNLCGNIIGNTVQYPSEKCRIGWGTIAYNINSITYFKHASNYNTVNGGSNTSTTVQNPSIAVDKSNWRWHIDDHNIVPCAKIYNPNRAEITTCGIQIRDGNQVIASKSEQMETRGKYASQAEVWYNCISECGVTLRPGHTYTWQIYAYVGGQYVTTNWQTIKTTGTAKPGIPSFSTSKKDYAVGDAVTVSWGADTNATKGYSVTLTQTKGGSYTKTLTTSTYNATSLAFSLPTAGEYKITGYAMGGQNGDTGTLNKTITAHEPSKVRFVEKDAEGNENLLCEQIVKYGYSAQAPTGVSRKGHTFTGWKGEYSNVTSDRTIVAQFKRNTYKIKFCDKDGKEIKTESVLFEDDATPPEPPEAELGYVFAGWDSESYKNVQGNATIKASYVWANDDLPVVVTLNKCEFKEDGYIVNYDIKNNPNARTKGRALVSLKTSKDKLLDTTESNAFSLAKGEEKTGLEIYVPYEGTATQASLHIINGFSKGIPISEVETISVERTWSDWSADEPDEDNEIETRQEYRYQDKELTTTRTSNNEGWTLYDTILDSYWTYGSWSGYSRSAYSGYTNTTSMREVQTRTVQDSAAYTLYNWYYYRYWNSSAGTYYYTYSSSMGGTRYDWQTNYVLPQIGTYSGHAGYKPPGGKNFSGEIWFLGSTQNVPATSHTEWRYRDATKGYTYYWYRWKDWTDWTADEVIESDSRKVETRTAYRYRAKMEDIEDNSGDSYKTTGTVDKELAGKQATLLVYKNDEPSDSNNEYVGQTVIGKDGEYEFEYITREKISAKTGDYTVALAIEGASEPIFVETIEAPKPTYTVTFTDDDGNIIDTQEVTEGKSATSPDVPEKEHYSFVGWDFGLTNVRDDMEITAQYTKNKYSVAYVNWETKEVETQVFSYNEPLNYPDETTVEGYDFTGWTTLDGEKVDVVTDNLVLMANYKIQTYTINFYDAEETLISTQQVDYGNDAIEPEAPAVDKMVFKGWSSYDFIQANGNLDVYPIYEYIETTSDPSCDTPSGVLDEACDIHLSAEEGATIYYTTDGTMPTILSEVYDGKLTVDKNTFLQYMAVAPDKNTSQVKNASYLLISSEDDEGALVIKKDEYNINRGETAELTFFLSDESLDVEFYSLNEDVASVDEDGTIHANQVGTTQIFARTADSRYADYCDIVVTTDEIDAESIVLSTTSFVGLEDSETVISAEVYPEDTTDKTIDWYVDDTSVAEVDQEGNVKIVGEGKTYLTAYSQNGTCRAECVIEGKSSLEESKLSLSSQLLVLQPEESATLYVYYNDSDTNCSWSSWDEEVATVSEDGVVTAKKAGYSIVYATMADGQELMCTILVQAPPATEEPTDSPEKPNDSSPDSTAAPQPTTTPQSTPTPKATAAPKPEEQKVETESVKKPAKVKIKKVKKAGKKKLKVTWKWMVGMDGFQVQYARNKAFTKNRKTKNASSLAEQKTLKSLKSKKIYYVRVRAYEIVGGKKVYGEWSSVKKAKVK